MGAGSRGGSNLLNSGIFNANAHAAGMAGGASSNFAIANIVQYLLARGGDPNIKDSCHWTPLHYACQRGDIEVVRLLLRSGAVDSEDDLGTTARDLAEKCGHHVLLTILANPITGGLNTKA